MAAAGNINRREDQEDIAAAGNIKRREEHEDIAAGYIKRRVTRGHSSSSKESKEKRGTRGQA